MMQMQKGLQGFFQKNYLLQQDLQCCLSQVLYQIQTEIFQFLSSLTNHLEMKDTN